MRAMVGLAMFSAALLMQSTAYAASAEEGVAAAKAAVEAHRGKPQFTAPGPAFDIKACAAGKKMLSIPNNSTNPFLKGIIDRETRAKADTGLEVQEWQNQGQPNQWVQGMEFAVKNKFTAVDLISGIDPKVIEPQIKAANAAGVKVFASHFYDPSQTVNPNIAGSLAIGFNAVGKLLADWTIAKTNGKANIIVVRSDEVPPTEPLTRGIAEELAANCPGCKIVQQINVGIAEWGTKIQPSVQAALLANPTVNYVIPIYDSMSQFVVPAIALTGKAATVKVATFNGTPFVLDFVQQGKVEMDIGESLDWIARATVDGYLRSLCGLQMPKELNVPFYIFDASNVKDAGTPATFDKGYGTEYLDGFRKVWTK